MVNSRLVSILAFCASLLAFCVIGLGAFTRLVDAGLGCPDWPGCYGHLAVPSSALIQSITDQYPSSHFVAYKAWAEMIHRYFVGGLSTLILITVAFLFSNKILRTRINIILSLVLLFLLSYQILLGRWTVTLQLLPIIVTEHLLGGFLILSILWLIFLVNYGKTPYPKAMPSLRSHRERIAFLLALFGFFILLGQIFLGAWTSTNYAALSCPDFPFCHNEGFQGWQFREAFNIFAPIGLNYEGGLLSEVARQTIQLTHRIGALILTLYIMIFMGYMFWVFQKNHTLLKTLYVIIGFFILQLCIGMTNVLFKLPLATALAHTLLAALLLISFITLLYQLLMSHERINT